jgi:hypothetical protein
MAGVLPWNGDFLFSNYVGVSREDRLKQRITRAIEKTEEDGALHGANEWEIQTLAERLYAKLEPFFKDNIREI